MRQRRLIVGLYDGTDLHAQVLLGMHNGMAVESDAGVLLAGLHDNRELPLVLIDGTAGLQDRRVGRNGDAGAGEQARRHELVAR